MTEYERGRRDAIRDVILYLRAEQRRFYESEPEHRFIEKRLEDVERLTAVAPDGTGHEWTDAKPAAIDAARGEKDGA